MKMNMKIVALTSTMLMFIMGFLSTGVLADQYGGDLVRSVFNSIWNSWWPVIALFFLIGIYLAVFGAPAFLKKLFGFGRG